MSIITLQESLSFLDIGKGYFEITAENDVLSMTSSEGGPVNIDVPDGTYEGDDLATALETAMNANNTLTGTGTINFSVSYSSSTYKFTIIIDEGGLNTITIDVSASDAALTFGFTSDPTAAASIISDSAAFEDPTAIVQTILNGVDKWIKEYCQRDFEVPTADYREYYDGDGTNYLFLKQFPIISVSRLSIGRNNAIKVNNSLAATYATVSVTSTGVVLNKDGTEKTLAFSPSNTTLTLMVAAIAAETNWQASVVNSAYASYASTELIEVMGLECLNASWAYLEIPETPEDALEVDKNEGSIYRAGGFPRGQRNVRVDYKAGFVVVPEDLKLAVKMLVKMIYDRRDQEAFGVEQFSLGYVRSVLTKEMPNEAREILSRYEKIEV